MTNRQRKVIAGLDIGTTKVCAFIAAYTSSSDFEIIGLSSHPCHGLKKGSVVHMDKTIHSIRTTLEEAKAMSGTNISKVSLGIAGGHIYSFNNSGVVAIKGQEVMSGDVQRAIEAAKNVALPQDREILHVLPQEYRIDELRGIKNPVGMSGSRLEVRVHIVTGATSLIQNLVKCVEKSGYEVESISLQPLCSSAAVLTDEEKDIGVVVVDIGGGTTDLAIWKEGQLIHSHILPVGGNHFTNDLSVALKIPFAEAEKLKIDHGSVIPERIDSSTVIPLHGLPGTRPREVQLFFIAEVLGARAEELLENVNKVIVEKNLKDEIVGGYVFTGGGSLLKCFPELAEYYLERPTKIGFPISIAGISSIMQSPKFSTGLGLLMESRRKIKEKEDGQLQDVRKLDLMSRLAESLKNVFREIF